MSDLERQPWEKKIEQDSDFAFKVAVRRNKLLGRWAADQLGRTGDEADAYVAEVVKSDFEEVGDDDVVRKVLGDLKAADLEIDERAVRDQIATFNKAAAESLE